MINHINGKLVEKNPTHVVIECNGVGYFINISLYSYDHLPQGEACKLLTYLSAEVHRGSSISSSPKFKISERIWLNFRIKF